MIYILFFILSLVVVWRFNVKGSDNSPLLIVFVFLFFLLGIFRDTTVGTDIMLYDGGGYYEIWQSPKSNSFSYVEKGFVWLTIVLKGFCNSYYFYYGAIFFITMLFYYLSAKKMHINPALFFAIYILSSAFIGSFNTIRQNLALSAGVLVFSHLLYGFDIRNNTLKNVIKRIALFELFIFLLSYGFHTSILILTILPLFLLKGVQNLLSKELILWGLLLIVTLINLRYGTLIQKYVILANGLLNIGERADSWAQTIELYGDSIEASHGVLSSFVMGAFAILLSKGQRGVLFYIGFIGLLLASMASVNLGTIGRVFNNLSIFIYFYYALIFCNFRFTYKLFNLKIGWVMLTLLIVFWISVFYNTVLLNETVSPYHTYLFK